MYNKKYSIAIMRQLPAKYSDLTKSETFAGERYKTNLLLSKGFAYQAIRTKNAWENCVTGKNNQPSLCVQIDQLQIDRKNEVWVCIIIAIIQHSSRWGSQESLWIQFFRVVELRIADAVCLNDIFSQPCHQLQFWDHGVMENALLMIKLRFQG